MTSKKKMDGVKAAPAVSGISAETFPALREFLRGYLHQDWTEDYESPAEAAQDFCKDADGEERAAVAGEWERFRRETKNLSLPAVAGVLTTDLGSGWVVRNAEQMEAISEVFRPFSRKM